MNKKLVFGIIISLIILLLIIFLVLRKKEINYFNQVTLSENNRIFNLVDNKYYDTVLSVGLDETGMKDVVVIILPITQASKNNFTGDLKAHIRYHDGNFYLYTDSYGHKESIRVISHEIIHIKQYLSKDLVFENGIVYWRGDVFDLQSSDYETRPWENEAFSEEGPLNNKISNILYN